MTKQIAQVCVYIFKNDDGHSADQRLQEAAEHYCREMAGRWPCEEALAGNLADRLRVERTAAGKPYFPDCPGLHFSISHSGAYWACAMGNVNVGLDLQEHVTGKNETKEEAAVRYRKMAHRFFHPLEAEFVEWNSYEHFFTVWTAREAYVKNTGQGIDKYFSEHCVVPQNRTMWEQIAVEPPGSKLKELDEQCGSSWTALGKWFCSVDFREDYSLCVCAEEAFDWMILEC